MTFSSSKRGVTASEKTCVLFDAAGNIQHVHTVVSVGGAREQTEADIERKAHQHAGMLLGKAAALTALHVPVKLLKVGAPVMVDPKTRQIIRIKA